MFEAARDAFPSEALSGPAGALDAHELLAMRAKLVEALSVPSGLDDSGRIDEIRAMEELVSMATARQAQLSAELDESQRSMQAAQGVPPARQGSGVAHQVAWARRESPHRGQVHLGLAKIVQGELPCLWRAWRTGRITEWKATIVARETACLSLEDRLAVDQTVCGDPDRLEAMGDFELAKAIRAEAYRLDPESFVARRRKAESERHVTTRPAPDCMTWVSALLPVKEGVAVHAQLTRAADAARAAGDARTKGQVMADTLVGSVLGQQDDDTIKPASPGVQLSLLMSDQSLFSTSDEPAHLDGFGPIPAELAREIVAGALRNEEDVWLRRLYAHPRTGELVAMDAKSRLFKTSLGRFIRLRDQVCRTLWCDAPIRHKDHARQHSDGGDTSADNGQGLCEACDYAKQAPGWRARPTPTSDGGHQIETRLPTGHLYRTRPPVVATIHRRPALTIDYVLAG